MRRPQLRHQLGRIVPPVVRHNLRQPPQRTRECPHRQRPFPGGLRGRRVHGGGHGGLRAPPPVHRARLRDRPGEDAQGVVEGAFRLVEDVVGGPAEDHAARLAAGAPGEAHEGVLPDHDIVDGVASAEPDEFRVVEGGGDLAAGDRGEAFDPVEIGVFDGHDAVFGEDLLGEVVDELAVDEAVDAVVHDFLAFAAHLVLLGLLDLRHFGEGVHFDAGAPDLDFVGVHGGVGQEDFGVLNFRGLAHPRHLPEQESRLEVRVGQAPPGNLDNLDVVQIPGPLEPQHRVHGERRKMLLLVRQQLAAERRPRNLQQILPERHRIVLVIHRHALQTRPRLPSRQPPPGADRLRVDPLREHQRLRLPQELPAQDGHGGGAVAHLPVLDLGDVHEDLGGGVVEVDGVEDGGAVVGDGDGLVGGRDALEDLVHAFGAQGGLDHVGDGDGPQEGRQTGVLALVDGRALVHKGGFHGGRDGELLAIIDRKVWK
mmetsp:Transcript_13265/g.26504  ORF Transcript_13265/g.26504 Transcript_13265/m.26504 type:complete len:483 (-) Transcript_13265:112-1560(-)